MGGNEILHPPFSKNVTSTIQQKCYIHHSAKILHPPFSKNITSTIQQKYYIHHSAKMLHPPFSKNVTSTIQQKCYIHHSAKILPQMSVNISSIRENIKPCNCNVKEDYPLKVNCLVVNSLYEGTVTSRLPGYKAKVYTGVCEPSMATIKCHLI